MFSTIPSHGPVEAAGHWPACQHDRCQKLASADLLQSRVQRQVVVVEALHVVLVAAGARARVRQPPCFVSTDGHRVFGSHGCERCEGWMVRCCRLGLVCCKKQHLQQYRTNDAVANLKNESKRQRRFNDRGHQSGKAAQNAPMPAQKMTRPKML